MAGYMSCRRRRNGPSALRVPRPRSPTRSPTVPFTARRSSSSALVSTSPSPVRAASPPPRFRRPRDPRGYSYDPLAFAARPPPRLAHRPPRCGPQGEPVLQAVRAQRARGRPPLGAACSGVSAVAGAGVGVTGTWRQRAARLGRPRPRWEGNETTAGLWVHTQWRREGGVDLLSGGTGGGIGLEDRKTKHTMAGVSSCGGMWRGAGTSVLAVAAALERCWRDVIRVGVRTVETAVR